MAYQYNRALSDNKKKWKYWCYNMDEPLKHAKKPETKDHILYDTIYIKCPE